MANPRYEAPSWDAIYDMLLDIARRIRESNYSPDVIVGVARGGWPPARIMSDLLENQNLANMKVVFYKGIGVQNRKPVITQPVTSDVSGRRVLVVDDVADSGHSLKVVANHLRRKGAKDIRVCTIYYKPRSIVKPHFYARKTTKWVIFPWERLETLHAIFRKRSTGANVAGVVKELKGSGMTARLIKKLRRVEVDNGNN